MLHFFLVFILGMSKNVISKRIVTVLNQENLQDCLNKTSVDFWFPLLSAAIFLFLRASLTDWTDYFLTVIRLHFLSDFILNIDFSERG